MNFFIIFRAFRKSCNDVIESRRAIRDLNTMYPDLTAEELAGVTDTTCIICREEMQVQQSIKRLGCLHIFHKNCLCSWFQRQQTCNLQLNSNKNEKRKYFHRSDLPYACCSAISESSNSTCRRCSAQCSRTSTTERRSWTDTSTTWLKHSATSSTAWFCGISYSTARFQFSSIQQSTRCTTQRTKQQSNEL